MKKEIEMTIEKVKMILSNKRYLALTMVSSAILFLILYYLLVVNVAFKSIWISSAMSGPLYVTESIVTILAISSLFGIYLSMFVYKYFLYRSLGIFGFLSAGVGAFGVGCPTCGAFLFGLVGVPLALGYLPFKGAELRILSIFLLAFSIYLTAKSLEGKCKIKRF